MKDRLEDLGTMDDDIVILLSQQEGDGQWQMTKSKCQMNFMVTNAK
jgi:hypothetical protein